MNRRGIHTNGAILHLASRHVEALIALHSSRVARLHQPRAPPFKRARTQNWTPTCLQTMLGTSIDHHQRLVPPRSCPSSASLDQPTTCRTNNTAKRSSSRSNPNRVTKHALIARHPTRNGLRSAMARTFASNAVVSIGRWVCICREHGVRGAARGCV